MAVPQYSVRKQMRPGEFIPSADSPALVPPGAYSRGTVITVPYGFLSIVQRKESDDKGKNPLDRDSFLCYNVRKNDFKELIPMKCPFCGFQESKVVDSRHSDDNLSIRRRRECLGCQRRFTTYEMVEVLPMVVVKKDGSRQNFDKSKILTGLQRSCVNRPVSIAEMERITNEIEQAVMNSMEREISTNDIGEMVMERLKPLDEVSYIRFASVYRQFKDVNSFMRELTKILEEK